MLDGLVIFGVVGLFLWSAAKVAIGLDHENDRWLGGAFIVVGALIVLRLLI